MIIDSHHHFWVYDPVAFDWIDDSMKTIRRDFLPHDLREVLAASGVDQAISVQARQTPEETSWLSELAEEPHELIECVVGWVDLRSPDIDARLSELAGSSLVGVRHIAQAEPDDRFLIRDDFQRGLRALRRYDLVYDILIYERHLPVAIELVDAHPDQPFVLDHIAKPDLRGGQRSAWEGPLRELARRENLSCKLSGVVTEADFEHWTPEQIRPYLDVVLEAFGPSRLMFGSDWPVCLVAIDYPRWLDIVRDLIAPLSQEERSAILGDTAREVYALG
ncbi:MAG: amidohydrolase family protein [Planctomycetota bacterium]